MNHVTYVRKWIMPHVYVNESCHIYTCTTTPLPIASNISMSSCSPLPLQDVFKCVTWRIHTYDMTHSQVWHDSFTSVTCLIHTCDSSLNLPLCLSLSPPPPPHQLPARLPWVRAALCSGAARRNTLTALANSSWPTYLTTVYVFKKK